MSNSSHQCPSCDRDDFGTERALNTHHAKSHGESLMSQDVPCENCGEMVTKARHEIESAEHHFCSTECHFEWLNETGARGGENHPNWNGGMIEVPCDWCGSTLERTPHRVQRCDHFFCGDECKGSWQSENLTGENSPVYAREVVTCDWCEDAFELRQYELERGSRFCSEDCYDDWQRENVPKGKDHPQYSRVAVECDWCGEETLRKPASLREGQRTFCDTECLGSWRSEHWVGENSPTWDGGQFPYGPGWTESKKEAVREHYDRECVDCGVSESEHLDEHGRKLSVHHIHPARDVDNAEDRNSADNLVPLCISCHNKWEKMAPLRPSPEPAN